jgi:hypothetical protein
MAQALLLLLLLCMGCLGAPFVPRSECQLDSGARVRVEEDTPDCALYQRAADYSREAILDAGFASPEAYAELERGTTFWVHEEPLLFTCYGDAVAGCEYTVWSGGQWVELPGRAVGIVHEMLHGIDQLVLGVPQPVTAAHSDWRTKGAAPGARLLCPVRPEDCYLEGSWWDAQMHRLVKASSE